MKRFLIYASLFILALNVTSLHSIDIQYEEIELGTSSSPSGGWSEYGTTCSSLLATLPSNPRTIVGGLTSTNNNLCLSSISENFVYYNSGSNLITVQNSTCSVTGTDTYKGDYSEMVTVSDETLKCAYYCDKTDAFCRSSTGNDSAFLNPSSCTCSVPCEPAPPPEGLNRIRSFSNIQECQDVQANYGTYTYNSQSYTNLTCYSSVHITEYPDTNVVSVRTV